jgi:hypothetical protein
MGSTVVIKKNNKKMGSTVVIKKNNKNLTNYGIFTKTRTKSMMMVL